MKTKFFRIISGVAGIYHVVLAGVGLILPIETTAKVVSLAFGVVFEINSHIELLLKFTSTYMLAFGIMLLILSSDPIKYRNLAIPTLTLFGIRLINRVLFFSLLLSAGMSETRNIIGTTLILFFFVALLLTMPKKQA
jgi:hypothetical protein